MRVTETGFPGLVVIEPAVFEDERGFFLESFNRRTFAESGIDVDFVQDNHAYSRSAGVLRGFHFQLPPATQAKLVWVTRGRVLDVVIDLRKGSPMYGSTFHMEVDAKSRKRLFVPRGFAHAYLTLEPDTEFMYKVDAYYAPEFDTGIRFDDPAVGFDWAPHLHGMSPILSDKDKQLGSLAEFDSPFDFSKE
ncbi:dTDP-4-dehydrorhamnose 3,5-epimerase [Pseudodesulfovibrio senegalensis]|jgi:dTDP-4-dehydrorhamnose 3,5-epimerase|uniref:dTDP-4-dehydrorhamnose 3,5-epimerase n=1 Tax=Pseudodesulfovibrio senegalensis TaxID=1721087 RepID=A0A6N6MY10_9BACT|nr:dTDP-4-dehydrorhamnose 3,5-epimerase [Pseudodesulfovibrio senegalensis]KAB1440284.1 dTDP-4-dehydrorhamnose 3,5-epimerase [Pseudodesulfovibrio senegalensis]